jgi:hypothetical protein
VCGLETVPLPVSGLSHAFEAVGVAVGNHHQRVPLPCLIREVPVVVAVVHLVFVIVSMGVSRLYSIRIVSVSLVL